MDEGTQADAWFVYLVECADRSLYTGIAKDVERRVSEHNEGRGAARYTRARRPVTLVYREAVESRAAALRREAVIKKLSRRAKLCLIAAAG